MIQNIPILSGMQKALAQLPDVQVVYLNKDGHWLFRSHKDFPFFLVREEAMAAQADDVKDLPVQNKLPEAPADPKEMESMIARYNAAIAQREEHLDQIRVLTAERQNMQAAYDSAMDELQAKTLELHTKQDDFVALQQSKETEKNELLEKISALTAANKKLSKTGS